MTTFAIGFDDATVAWLLEIAEETRTPVADLVASIVRQVAEDDRAGESTEEARPVGAALH